MKWGHSSRESALRLLTLSGSCSDEDTVVRSEVADLFQGSFLPSSLLWSSQTAGNCRMVRPACGEDVVKGEGPLAECDRDRH